MPQHMRRNWRRNFRAVGNDFYAALRGANGTIHIIADSKMLFEQGHGSIGHRHGAPFGLTAGAFAKNGERAFLPIDILRGEGLPLADAQSGIEQKPNKKFVLKFQARVFELVDLIQV